ncbi:hypothetical protein AC791_14315 [Klebsiella sp. RIT-PI-d]|nr:hypothetical protein AC791_14315 [Klebsiella sp. RIT-PI-d]
MASLVTIINKSDNTSCLTLKEEKFLLEKLYKIRKTLPNQKKSEVAKAIRLLEKTIYSCILNDQLKLSHHNYSREIEVFSNPGTSHNKNITAGIQLSAGCSIGERISAAQGSGKVDFTHTTTSDTDDEGIVGYAKEKKIQGTLSVNATMACTDEISLHAGSEISAKKTIAHGVNYNGGTHDYFKEKFSEKLFSYKNQSIKDKLFTHRHSLRHYQQQAQNNQPLLEQSWSALTNRQVKCNTPVPFQADKSPKRIYGHGYTAKISASAHFSSLADAGAKLQYDYAENDIEVKFSQNVFSQVLHEKLTDMQSKNLDTITKNHVKEMSTTLQNRFNLTEEKINTPLSIDELRLAIISLNKEVDEYTECVQKYSAGQLSEGKKKHEIEKRWGVKESGRYGFLQRAELVLTTFISRFPSESENNVELKEMMVQLNNKIVSPHFTYDKLKLKPLLSFNNSISINNHSHTVTAELNAHLGNANVAGGGKVSVAIIAKHVSNPYRIRAGEHRDIEITLSGNVTLSGILSKLTAKFASEAGVELSDLHSAVSDAFSSSVDLSQGVKITIRYFSPDWSQKDEQKRSYSHQVTTLQVITDANITAKLVSPTHVIAGGINMGAGVSNANAVAQRMGTDTLNYLMLRYNYLCGKPQEQPVWQRLIKDNRTNLLNLMKNILTVNTNSNHELDILLKEKIDSTPDSEQNEIWNEYTQIRKSIKSAIDNPHSPDDFEKGMAGLTTLMNWHKERTDKLFGEAIKPGEISEVRTNAIKKRLSPLLK